MADATGMPREVARMEFGIEKAEKMKSEGDENLTVIYSVR